MLENVVTEYDEALLIVVSEPIFEVLVRLFLTGCPRCPYVILLSLLTINKSNYMTIHHMC
jgi:hypothetical protein